ASGVAAPYLTGSISSKKSSASMKTPAPRDFARRSTREPITQLRPRVQAVPAVDGTADIVRHRFGPPQIVVREHANNAVRWKPGERLNHLLEEACIRFADHDAVIAGDVTVSYR